MSQRIVFKAEGRYPWTEKYPERTKAALLAEIEKHMAAYGMTELKVSAELIDE